MDPTRRRVSLRYFTSEARGDGGAGVPQGPGQGRGIRGGIRQTEMAGGRLDGSIQGLTRNKEILTICMPHISLLVQYININNVRFWKCLTALHQKLAQTLPPTCKLTGTPSLRSSCDAAISLATSCNSLLEDPRACHPTCRLCP